MTSSQSTPLTVYRLAAAAARHWRLLVTAPAVAAGVAALLSFAVPPQYSSRATFIPQTSSRSSVPAAALSLASQLGVQFGGSAGSQSPMLYIQLVNSRRILGGLLEGWFPNPERSRYAAADSVALLDLLRVPTSLTAPRRFEAGLRKLRNAISVDVDEKTSLITVTVATRYPALARDLASRSVALIDDFNRQTRQSQARERRGFAEGRATDVQQTLRDAERALEQFYSQNRLFRESPELVFREAQLQRQLAIQQELYLTLRREAETARLEEVNDTPLLTIVDAPAVPARRSSPNRGLILLFGFLLGSAVAATRILLDSALRVPLPAGVLDVDEFRADWHHTVGEWRRFATRRRKTSA